MASPVLRKTTPNAPLGMLSGQLPLTHYYTTGCKDSWVIVGGMLQAHGENAT